MKELSIEEIKQIEFDILKHVADVCDKNGLEYFLDGGTLLGAVRHKGFIPWDDDIDIIVKRKDYNKLIGLLKNDERYPSIDYRSSKNYYLAHAKIYDKRTIIKELTPLLHKPRYGVFIDVFPYDNLPDNKIIRLFHQKVIRLKKAIWSYSVFPKSCHSIKNKILCRISKSRSLHENCEEITKTITKYNHKKTKSAVSLTSGFI